MKQLRVVSSAKIRIGLTLLDRKPWLIRAKEWARVRSFGRLHYSQEMAGIELHGLGQKCLSSRRKFSREPWHTRTFTTMQWNRTGKRTKKQSRNTIGNNTTVWAFGLNKVDSAVWKQMIMREDQQKSKSKDKASGLCWIATLTVLNNLKISSFSAGLISV